MTIDEKVYNGYLLDQLHALQRIEKIAKKIDNEEPKMVPIERTSLRQIRHLSRVPILMHAEKEKYDWKEIYRR